MILELLPMPFAVCKLQDMAQIDWNTPFGFAAKTDGECAWVCPQENVPAHCVAVEPGWCALRVAGTLDFSLIGILAQITSALAAAGVGLFALSTYDTDYVLVKQVDWPRARQALCAAGHAFRPY